MSEAKNYAKDKYYEIIFQGYIDEHRMRWFDGLDAVHLPGGETKISGELVDQAALFGVLSRIRDLGLPLLLVRRGDVVLDPSELLIDLNNQKE